MKSGKIKIPSVSDVTNNYSKIIERVFLNNYQDGVQRVEFSRDQLIEAANALEISLPKNLGDIIYSFRYRTPLPSAITEKATSGAEWVIRPAGKAKYAFALVSSSAFTPNPNLIYTKIPDSTPGLIDKYSISDEQALLAKIRYNRLIDVFTGVTCYSMQNHLRTSVPGIGQIETDEIYIGIDKLGRHYIIPVQAKGKKDKLGLIQIEQDFALCKHRFCDLICCPIAAVFLTDGTIALFRFQIQDAVVQIAEERHYRLTQQEQLSAQEIIEYNLRLDNQ